ncbi:MAG: DUF4912 domain-containing protein [Treponema sp.]|nr:DUF4912 domain-containing protein [Treponema sp.]
MGVEYQIISYLESLSNGELAELARGKGLFLPPSLDRIFVIGELLELELEREEGQAEERAEDAGKEPSPVSALPEDYDLCYVDVLVRDPSWVFVFWEEKKRPVYLNAEDDRLPKGRCLHVIPLTPDNPQPPFTVELRPGDRSMYLGIPEDLGRYFRIDLCATGPDGPFPIAGSHPFRLPALRSPVSAVSSENPPSGSAFDRWERLGWQKER